MHRRTNPNTFMYARQLRHNLTEPEAILWQLLRANRLKGIHFRRQHAIGGYISDFCAPKRKIVIELDGSQHLDHECYDAERDTFLRSKGFKVLRFWNSDVTTHPERVLEAIHDALNLLDS